jgi:predicted Zn-dependent protease
MGVTSDRRDFATVLVEIGELSAAEAEVAAALEEQPEQIETLDLLAKIKHIRGELSAAIACWAQVYAQSPDSEVVLMRLASMLNLASNPERGAGEYLALGRDQLWRKPTAHLELEEAFRLFVARRPDEARSLSERLAAKYRNRDPELYKMAVLAKAWFAELSGDLDAACEILEQLGTERGFESDPDRARALSRVYELIGSREDLEKAVNICLHLDRQGQKVTNLGRLAKLFRALGRQEEAKDAQRRFFKAFRRRMHRPSFRQAIRVAARRYIPIDRLASIAFPETALPKDASDRERALALALTGQRAASRELFSAANEAIDRKYLADLERLDGQLDEAARLYAETLAEEEDPRVLVWLLGQDALLSHAADHFRDAANSARALEVLESTLRMAPLRAGAWRALGALRRLRGESGEAERCFSRAAALEEATARRDKAVGRVLAASVYHFVGRAKGLIHEVWAERKPVGAGRGGFLEELLGNLTPEMIQGVRNTFLSVREYAQAKLPHQTAGILDYNYTFKVTKEDEPSSGLSAGLPTALAFLSVFLNRPVPQDVASSGVLVADSHDVQVVRPVGEPEYKVRGAYNRNLRMLLLPEGNRTELEESPRVPPAVCAEIVHFVSDLDQAASLLFGEDLWVR